MNYMIEFILTSAFMSFTVGGFISSCIINTIIEDGKPIVKWIVEIMLAAAIGCGIGGLITLQSKNDDKAWNNGYCTECNEPYKFVNSVHHRSSDDEYYYTCDNCGHTIVVHELRER